MSHPEPAADRTLVFSHANGFPAGTYRRLFETWQTAGWTVHAVAQYGHDPRWPVSSNWPGLRDQLIDHLEQVAPQGAWLVGHSLGGLLSLLAAARRPDLARGLVLLDSPLITGWRAQTVRLAKLTRLISRVSPGRIAQRRRQHWPDRAAVLAHYAAKPVFAAWAPGLLEDYLDCGLQPAPDGGVRLAFERTVETRIYDTLPHHIGALLRRHPLRVPFGFIAGTASQEMRQAGTAASRQLAGPHYREIEGSHLFPMERPDATAAEVLALIAALAGTAHDRRAGHAAPGA
ncbi:MAG: hypothetical protein RL223_1460 [Pseudomonadota bacterium]|jgi:pimeloyl-ACP methyl ester carboxylesterase